MSDWRAAPLRELADIRVSNVDKKSSAIERSVRLCNYMDVYANEYIRGDLPFMEATATEPEISRFKVERGDVLITKDSETPDDIGIPAVVMEEVQDLICGYHIALLKPNKTLVDPVFLSKQLGRAETANYFARYAAGSTRYGLSNGAISNTRVLLPSLSRQRKIAAILTSVDLAIEKTESLIDKYHQIRAGLMHDLFTRGVLPNGELRPSLREAPALYKKTSIGSIPKEWAVERCADLCARICVGIVIQPTQYYVEQGVPAFRSANVRADGIDPTNFVYISQSANTILAKSQVKAGDILSVRTGYPGTSAVVPPEFEGANCIDVLISTPGPKVSSEYLCCWINSSFGKEQVLRQQGGMAQQHFNVGEMRELEVALPSELEQQLISDRLNAASQMVHAENQRLAKLMSTRLGLMQDLLTGRVPVNVDEPIAEPADA